MVVIYGEQMLANKSLVDRLRTVRGWSKGTISYFGLGWDGERIVFRVPAADDGPMIVRRYQPGGEPKMLSEAGRTPGLFPSPEEVDSDPVWLVEGESDVLAAFELGLPAVGVLGVQTWQPGWAERFEGRRVFVLFDCDLPGRRAADQVARSLVGSASEVRVVDLDPGRSDGFDLTDYLLDAIGPA